MTTFKEAAQNSTTTTNGCIAFNSTLNSCVNLFFDIGASRGKDIIPQFESAYKENTDYATRIALWARDVRSGAGERQIFRDILQYLEINDPNTAIRLIKKIPELGRYDDVLAFKTRKLKHACFDLIKSELLNQNQLAAKWMPRIKSINKYPQTAAVSTDKFSTLSDSQKQKFTFARDFCKYAGWTHKQYRKTLSQFTTCETQMCANKWTEINFEHVPSVASTRYRSAFNKHAPVEYAAYTAALASGTAKVNAGAVYPYDVIKTALTGYGLSEQDQQHIIAQWDAIPNYIGDASILPMVDVSGSMDCLVGNNKSLTCMAVAISLGLYLSSKNSGAFSDMFLTFSNKPKIEVLTGNIIQRVNAMHNADWGMNTNLEAAFDEILKVAVNAKIVQREMPKYMLILSDMQFDRCANLSSTALGMIQAKYNALGYQVPKIIFWNLHASGNVPVTFTEEGTCLVSGFSPSIMKSVLAADESSFTPVSIMEQTILDSKYDY